MSITGFIHDFAVGIGQQFLSLKGGRELLNHAKAFNEVLATRDLYVGVPSVLAVGNDASLGGAVDIPIHGKNFLQSPLFREQQSTAGLAVFGTATNYVQLTARMPGRKGNNIKVIISASDVTPSAADSLTTSETPTVTIVPETGSIDNTVAAINTGSKLIRATKVGTGGSISTLASTNLAGATGEGVKLYIGKTLIQDTTAHGATFVGSANGTHLKRVSAESINVNIDELDLAAGIAIPAGESAVVAGGKVVVWIEWVQPRFILPIVINVGA